MIFAKLLSVLLSGLLLFTQSITLAAEKSADIEAALEDGNLHIYFCGTGIPDARSQWLRHPSCLAVVYEGELFLIDAGIGTTLRFSQMGIPIRKISRVFLTHLHSDHFAGLASVINQSWIFGRSTRLPVYGPYGTDEVISGIKVSYGPDVWFRSINRQGLLNPNVSQAVPQVIDLGTEGHKQVWQHNELLLTAFPVYHEPSFPAFGYMLTYKNCKLIVTGDTRVFKAEADIVKDADVVISEVMSHPLQQKRLEEAKKMSASGYEFWKEIIHYHSDSLELAKMAQKANVRHLFLTHLDPSISESKADKQAFTAGMADHYTGPIIVADDMDEIVIRADGEGACKVTYHPK